MEFVITALLLTVIVLQMLQLRATRKTDTRLRVLGTTISKLMPQQNGIRVRMDSQANPHIDSKVVVTKRDTPDIPYRGARIGTAVHRELSNASEPADGGLQ